MDLSSITGTTGVPAMIYYSGMILIAVFFAGWFLNTKLKSLCEDNNRERDDKMREFEARLAKHESETLRVQEYNRDMNNIADSMKEIKQDVKDGFAALTLRIDNLSLKFNKADI